MMAPSHIVLKIAEEVYQELTPTEIDVGSKMARLIRVAKQNMGSRDQNGLLPGHDLLAVIIVYNWGAGTLCSATAGVFIFFFFFICI